MRGRHGGDRALAREDLHVQPRIGHRERRQPEVGDARRQRADLVARRALAQLDVDLGMQRAEALDDAGDERQQRRAGEAHAQQAGLAVVDAPRVAPRPVEIAEDRPRVAQERLARGRHLHPAARARQQLAPELLLQQPDLVAQRRLGHVQPRGGPAEVQLLRHGHEISELPELH